MKNPFAIPQRLSSESHAEYASRLADHAEFASKLAMACATVSVVAAIVALVIA